MTILLDTVDFLWFVSGNPKLSPRSKQEITNPQNEVFLSVVSLWEIIIKYALGKLPLPQPPEIYVPAQRERHRIDALNLEESSVRLLAKLPRLHRDPFDRMLICQAQDKGMRLASSDPAMRPYAVTLL